MEECRGSDPGTTLNGNEDGRAFSSLSPLIAFLFIAPCKKPLLSLSHLFGMRRLLSLPFLPCYAIVIAWSHG
jgi:hypothetical protein